MDVTLPEAINPWASAERPIAVIVSYCDTIRTKCVKRSLKDGTSLFGTDLANALNNHFPSISVDLPPIDLCSLPAYLPTPVPEPTITPMEVCMKLLKVKPFKARRPDGIPNRIIKEFAYELAQPVCEIFNKSLSSSIFPSDWKDASTVPIPKTQRNRPLVRMNSAPFQRSTPNRPQAVWQLNYRYGQ